MASTFAANGIQFAYPANWELTRDDSESGWTVTVQSPGTAFFLITFDGDMPEADAMTDTALEAMKGEYEGLEFEPATDTIAGQPARGHDMRFFSFDLTNTCCTRSFYTDTGTVLLFWQSTDQELDEVESIMHAVRKSIVLEE